MKTTPIYLVSLVASLAFFHGCKKNDAPPTVAPPTTTTTQSVNASVEGRVVDETNAPVNNAIIKSGTSGVPSTTTQTDQNGIFRFNNIELKKTVGFVRVEKQGYFVGSRTFVTSTTGTNYVEIKLIKKTLSGSFVSSTGGKVSVGNGGSIEFPAASIVTEAGTNYNGDLNVYAYYIDPTGVEVNNIMPGTLRGLTVDNNERGLKSYSMMIVDLEGKNGERLNLATSKSAILTFPIPSSLRQNAPASIPLWYFEEKEGLWKEDGTATRQGDNYIGSVRHFSTWNCDVPYITIQVEAFIKDQNKKPAKGLRVHIGPDVVYTDSTGRFVAYVPPNEQLVLKAFQKCGTLLLTKNVGPFSRNENLGDLDVTISAPNTVLIQADVVDCNNQPIANAYGKILLDNQITYIGVKNGRIDTSISRCSSQPSTLSIFVYDAQNNKIGQSKDFTITTGPVNVGSIKGCSTAPNPYDTYVSVYKYINVGDFTYGRNRHDIDLIMAPRDSVFFTSPNDTVKMVRTVTDTVQLYRAQKLYTSGGIFHSRILEFEVIYKKLDQVVPGDTIYQATYPAPAFFVNIGANYYDGWPARLDGRTYNLSYLIYTKIEPVGGYVEGKYSFLLEGDDLIKGTFRFKRVQ